MRAALRVQAAACAGLVLLLALWATVGHAEATRTATVTAQARQTIRGWGMSLAWEANRVYGSPLTAPAIPDPAEQARFMDLLYGDPDSGLGLNVARYNIGGGANPDREACPKLPGKRAQPWAEMEGFQTGPGAAFNWSRDASQRRMLREARRRGADIFEAFSNSAPWWMTASGCVSGAAQAGTDNLRADAAPAFASYLATVAAHFRKEGIRFESVSPVNEPDGTWWVRGNNQEGSFATLPMQEAVVEALAHELAGSGMIVSGTEPNDLDAMTAWLGQMGPRSVSALGRVNVHQYQPSDPAALHRRAAALGKPLWASEVGCCFTDTSPIEGALFMAESIQQALGPLGAEVWCFWQPDWGVMEFADGRARPLKQFYAIAHYTRFIRPGFTVLASRGDAVTAAVSPDRRRLVLVAVNPGAEDMAADIRLAALDCAGRKVAAYRTTALRNLERSEARVDDAGRLLDQLPARSVTTYVIDGLPGT